MFKSMSISLFVVSFNTLANSIIRSGHLVHVKEITISAVILPFKFVILDINSSFNSTFSPNTLYIVTTNAVNSCPPGIP